MRFEQLRYFEMDEAFYARVHGAKAAGLESAPTGVITTPGTRNPKYVPTKQVVRALAEQRLLVKRGSIPCLGLGQTSGSGDARGRVRLGRCLSGSLNTGRLLTNVRRFTELCGLSLVLDG
jgi:hypothetical protein